MPSSCQRLVANKGYQRLVPVNLGFAIQSHLPGGALQTGAFCCKSQAAKQRCFRFPFFSIPSGQVSDSEVILAQAYQAYDA